MTKHQLIKRKCLVKRKHIKTCLIKTELRKLDPNSLLWAPVGQNIEFAISLLLVDRTYSMKIHFHYPMK